MFIRCVFSSEGASCSSVDVGSQILASLVEMHFSVMKGKDPSEQEAAIRTKLKGMIHAE